MLLLFTVLATFFSMTFGQTFSVGNLILTNYTIGAISAYKFQMSWLPLTPVNSSVSISFPSVLNYLSNGSYSCSMELNGTTISPPTCSMSFPTMSISNAFQNTDSSYFLVTVNLIGIQNPPNIRPITEKFTITFATNTSLTIATGQFSAASYIPAVFSACTLSSTATVISTSGSLNVELTLTNKIPSASGIFVIFPSVLSYKTTNINLYDNSMAPVCAGISANLPPTINCTNTSTSVVQLTNLSTSDLSAGSSISFRIATIRNPYSTAPLLGFNISSFDVNGYVMDSCTTASLTVHTPNKFTSFQIVNPGFVTETSNWDIFFTTSTPLAPPVTCVIIFPSEIDISSTETKVMVFGPNGTFSQNYTKNVAANSITLLEFAPIFFNSSAQYQISIENMVSPKSSKPTGEFNVSSYSGTFIIDTIQAGTNYVARVGTITSVQLFAGSKAINADTQMTFQVRAPHSIPITGGLKIIMPADFVVTPNTTSPCVTTSGNNVSGSPTCDFQGNTVYIYNLFTMDYTPTDLFSVTLLNVKNPSSTATINTINVTTILPSGGLYYDIDVYPIGTLSYTPEPAQIALSNFSITVSNDIVAGTSSIYTFGLLTAYSIPLNGKITLMFPSEIIITNNASFVASFAIISNLQNASGNCQASVIGLNTVDILNCFNISSVPANSNVSFSFGAAITNPPSTAPTSSFQIYSKLGSNIIEFRNTSKTVAMSTPAAFALATIRANDSRNGKVATYTITIRNSLPYSNQTVIILSFLSSNFSLPSSPTCTSTNITLFNSVSCVETTNGTQTLITITLNTVAAQINAGTTMSFDIASITNPPNSRPTTSMSLVSQTPASASIERQATGLVVATTAGPILPASVEQNQGFLKEIDNYTFYITPSNRIPSDGIISVLFPGEVTIVTGSVCSAGANITGSVLICTANLSLATVNVTLATPGSGSFSYPGGISFKINGIRNMATFSTTNSFQIFTFTSDGFAIDSVTSGVLLSPLCNSPCRSCLTTNKNSCNSCYNDSTIVLANIRDDFVIPPTCATSCSAGSFLPTGSLVCSACDSKCSDCQGSATNCSACKSSGGTNYYFHANTCNSTCPNGYYGDNNTYKCLDCPDTCSICISAQNCTACKASNKMFNNSCYATCPPGSVDLGGPTCQSCNTSCATCETTTTKCTSCAGGKFLYLNQCLDQCPPGVYPYNNTCTTCIPPCNQCSQDPRNCTSCLTGFLYGNTCGDGCPDTYYGDIPNKNCSKCQSPCLTCNSLAYCTACTDPTKINYNGACLSKCLPGTFQLGRTCDICSATCKECEGSAENCIDCGDNFYLYNGKCVSECPEGLFTYERTCVSCYPPCRTCPTGEPSTCSTCNSSSEFPYLVDGRCLSGCPDGYYGNSLTTLCQPCASPCATCETRNTTCLSCLQTSSTPLVYNGQCVSTCPLEITVKVGSSCHDCDSNCATCVDITTKCTSCKNGLLLAGNACMSECPTGYISDGMKCSACSTGCLSCIDRVSNCTSCAPGYYYNDNTCLSTCPVGMYGDNSTSTCLTCKTPCVQCTNSTFCDRCDPTSSTPLSLQGVCVDECKSPYIFNVNGVCKKCPQGCSNCTTATSTATCTSCEDGYSLVDGSCVGLCGIGEIYNETSKSCVSNPLFTYLANFREESNGIAKPSFLVVGLGGGISVVSIAANAFSVPAAILPMTFGSASLVQLPSYVANMALLSASKVKKDDFLEYYDNTLMNSTSTSTYSRRRLLAVSDLSIGAIRSLIFDIRIILSIIPVIGYIILNSAFYMAIYRKLIANDDRFKLMQMESRKNLVISRTIIFLSSVVSFKFAHVLTSKAFNLPYFSVDLEKSKEFQNRMNLLFVGYLALCFVPAVIVSILTLTSGWYYYEGVYNLSWEILVIIIPIAMMKLAMTYIWTNEKGSDLNAIPGKEAVGEDPSVIKGIRDEFRESIENLRSQFKSWTSSRRDPKVDTEAGNRPLFNIDENEGEANSIILRDREHTKEDDPNTSNMALLVGSDHSNHHETPVDERMKGKDFATITPLETKKIVIPPVREIESDDHREEFVGTPSNVLESFLAKKNIKPTKVINVGQKKSRAASNFLSDLEASERIHPEGEQMMSDPRGRTPHSFQHQKGFISSIDPKEPGVDLRNSRDANNPVHPEGQPVSEERGQSLKIRSPKKTTIEANKSDLNESRQEATNGKATRRDQVTAGRSIGEISDKQKFAEDLDQSQPHIIPSNERARSPHERIERATQMDNLMESSGGRGQKTARRNKGIKSRERGSTKRKGKGKKASKREKTPVSQDVDVQDLDDEPQNNKDVIISKEKPNEERQLNELEISVTDREGGSDMESGDHLYPFSKENIVKRLPLRSDKGRGSKQEGTSTRPPGEEDYGYLFDNESIRSNKESLYSMNDERPDFYPAAMARGGEHEGEPTQGNMAEFFKNLNAHHPIHPTDYSYGIPSGDEDSRSRLGPSSNKLKDMEKIYLQRLPNHYQPDNNAPFQQRTSSKSKKSKQQMSADMKKQQHPPGQQQSRGNFDEDFEQQ